MYRLNVKMFPLNIFCAKSLTSNCETMTLFTFKLIGLGLRCVKYINLLGSVHMWVFSHNGIF